MIKKYISKRFELSLDTYEQHAFAQAEVAGRLFSLTMEYLDTPPLNILELGCGTGLLTKKIHSTFPDSTLFLNDLNKEAARLHESYCSHFLPGDAETIDLPSSPNLIISASTFQWFNDLPVFFHKIKSLLTEGGTLAFSTFGPDNLRELRELENKGLDYLNFIEICHALQDAEFVIEHASEDFIKLNFPTPIDALRHLKFTGVNAGFSTHWSKGRLAAFSEKYTQHFGSADGVSLTYNPLYFIAKLS